MSSTYIPSINQAATATTTAKTATSATTESVMGKQEFLTLLVAQLQNQDPLNPDEPTEFTAQLAQFSSLEQLFNLNKSMENLVTSNSNSDRLSTLSTIGKEVIYQDGDFKYGGEPVTLGYQLDGQASEVTLALQLNGVTVRTLKGTEHSAGNHYLTWDGLTEDGQAAPQGTYSIVVQAKAGEGESVAVGPLIRSEVTGVDLNGTFGGMLITRAGEVQFNSILGVHEKNSAASETAAAAAPDAPATGEETTATAETATGSTSETTTES